MAYQCLEEVDGAEKRKNVLVIFVWTTHTGPANRQVLQLRREVTLWKNLRCRYRKVPSATAHQRRLTLDRLIATCTVPRVILQCTLNRFLLSILLHHSLASSYHLPFLYQTGSNHGVRYIGVSNRIAIALRHSHKYWPQKRQNHKTQIFLIPKRSIMAFWFCFSLLISLLHYAIVLL